MRVNLVNEYIKSQQFRDITKSLRIIMCEHPDWKKHGLGYACAKCGYYTGTDDLLNKKINHPSKQEGR